MTGPSTEYSGTTALVVVDVQSDFAHPAGSLYVTGGEELVSIVNTEVRRAEEAGAAVAYTQDWHPPSTPHFVEDGGIWPVHCVEDTWGAELVAGLAVAGPVFRKGGAGDGYSGFSNRDPLTGEEWPTGLGPWLRAHGVSTVVVCGLATDYCVKATALDAVALGLRTVVLLTAIRAVNVDPSDGARALAEMGEAGVELSGPPTSPAQPGSA